MRSSNRLLTEAIGRRGFEALLAYELFGPSPLLEVVTEKIGEFNPHDFREQQLAKSMRFLTEVLRETFARRYTKLSVLAFARILTALDHAVRVTDAVPDTQTGGYADDLQALNQVLQDFAEEFNAFRAWKLKLGERW